jgi:hypothetical protein
VPRGTRAIHGAEVDTDLHSSGHATLTHISVVEPWLAVTCWCEADVVNVEQWVVRWLGATLSCGRPECHSPDGDRSTATHRLNTSGVSRSGVKVGGTASAAHTANRIERGLFLATNDFDPADGYGRPTWAETTAERAKKAPRVARKIERQGRNRLSKVETALRREDVLREWRRLGNYQAVARMLGLEYHTVANDIHWLRSQGRI